MFARRDGPTALRPELIRAMAFTHQDGEIETAHGKVLVRAAMAAVWDGRLGQVLMLIRFVAYGHVDRFACQKRITSERELTEAVGAALETAERMGLRLDDPEFDALDDDGRRERVSRWNDLRTPGSPQAGFRVTPGQRPRADLSPPPKNDGRAILGRVAVVRRRIDELESAETDSSATPPNGED